MDKSADLEVMDHCPAHLIYQPISPDELLTTYKEPDETLKEMFDVAYTVNPLSQTIAFSASLFKPTSIKAHVFERRYLAGLRNNIERLLQMGPDYKLRLYLSADLRNMTGELISLAPGQMEVCVMRTGSSAFCPGSMWRFLALDDVSLDVVGVTDVDGPFDRSFIDTLQKSDPAKVLCKPAAREPTYHISDDVASGTMYGQYNLFQAGNFAVRPKQALQQVWGGRNNTFVQSTMVAFMQYGKDKRFREHKATIFNVPRAGHPDGWGRHPFGYGYDETYIKCVLYHLFACKHVILVGTPGTLEVEYLARDFVSPEPAC